MATFNADTVARVRELLETRPTFSEKRMFGGVGFLLGGNMCVGVWRDFLICRVGPDLYDECLQLPGAGEFDITGRPMKGWVMIAPDGYAADRALKKWVDRAAKFAGALPEREAQVTRPPRSTRPPRRRRTR